MLSLKSKKRSFHFMQLIQTLYNHQYVAVGVARDMYTPESRAVGALAAMYTNMTTALPMQLHQGP
jgi:hypothetical protein